MFGRWKNVMITVLCTTFTCVTVLVLCGCVLIACMKVIISRTLEKSIARYQRIPGSDPWSAECMSTEQVDESGSFICGEFIFDETIFDV